jgi:hypothetical protein
MRGGHAVARRLYRANLPRGLAGGTVTEGRVAERRPPKAESPIALILARPFTV